MGKRPKQEELPLDDPQRIEPVMPGFIDYQPVPAPPATDRIDEVILQIFKLTGQKVARGDPVVVATLLQASLLDDTTQKVGEQLIKRSDEAAASLTSAIAASRAHVESVDRSVARAFTQMASSVHAVSDQELTALRASFARTAAETLDHIRRNVLRRSGWRHWWRDPAACCVGLTFGLALGCLATLAILRVPSTEQQRLLHNGMLLDAAWPTLTAHERALISGAVGPKTAQPPSKHQVSTNPAAQSGRN
jgi:hypothetical protein